MSTFFDFLETAVNPFQVAAAIYPRSGVLWSLSAENSRDVPLGNPCMSCEQVHVEILLGHLILARRGHCCASVNTFNSTPMGSRLCKHRVRHHLSGREAYQGLETRFACVTYMPLIENRYKSYYRTAGTAGLGSIAMANTPVQDCKINVKFCVPCDHSLASHYLEALFRGFPCRWTTGNQVLPYKYQTKHAPSKLFSSKSCFPNFCSFYWSIYHRVMKTLEH